MLANSPTLEPVRHAPAAPSPPRRAVTPTPRRHAHAPCHSQHSEESKAAPPPSNPPRRRGHATHEGNLLK